MGCLWIVIALQITLTWIIKSNCWLIFNTPIGAIMLNKWKYTYKLTLSKTTNLKLENAYRAWNKWNIVIKIYTQTHQNFLGFSSAFVYLHSVGPDSEKHNFFWRISARVENLIEHLMIPHTWVYHLHFYFFSLRT